ncbi:unnamed protein product [Prunus armeniaca]|uniref:Uncharacterized protein n=1 Tax=Prunus armeniaca TaxID=36596 RepID=A0A6J5WH38_PRUAR|nr:unnamed protein product [Prunus armeniaca]CAB4298684.1 unnamed protein product [Prunus armeniaca]
MHFYAPKTAYLLVESFSFARFLCMPFPDEGFAVVYSLTIVTTRRNREARLEYLNLTHFCIQASNSDHKNWFTNGKSRLDLLAEDLEGEVGWGRGRQQEKFGISHN